jgi:hypothetical protein
MEKRLRCIELTAILSAISIMKISGKFCSGRLLHINSHYKELRIARLNYAEGQLVRT